MALFGFGKDKKDGGAASESVLAYFEEAQRLRTPFTLIGPKGTEVTATLQGVDEGAGLATFQVNGPLMADKGAKLRFVYVQESLRLGGTCQVMDVKPNLAVVELPAQLEMKERRATPRARILPKEGATITALTGLFEGIGITGIIENISETGARIRVEKALNIKDEKRLPLGSALVPAGQPFMLIKLNKLPKCPAVMELEGRAVYLENGTGGLAMGIAFDKPRSDFASALRGLAASRTSAIPSSVPPKARRKQAEPAPAAPSRSEDPQPPKPRTSPEPAAAPPSPAPVPKQESPSPEEGPAPAPEASATPRNEALLRLKKRSRAVVVLGHDPVFCDLLTDFLQEEGYGRILATTAMEAFLEHLQAPNLGLLILDAGMGTLEALEFVRKLQGAIHPLPPVILAAEDVSASMVIAAHRSGVSHLLVKPYALDETLSELLSRQMDV